MDIRLNWLHIKNFKGLRDFKLIAEGKNVKVYGNNGVGKTTLMDAFLWLLFDKDSTDRANFTVKPQDEHGNDIHHLQTEVEAELLVDGKSLKLRKMLEEKWTKKKGEPEKRLTGHTTSYWWNDVPVKAGEYKDRIDSLLNESKFKQITNPLYFNTKLPWQERREILLEICGDISDEQVIDSDKKLSKLKEVLNGRPIDDIKKMIADKAKRLEKERQDIPPRIDELMLSLPQEEPNYEAVETKLKEYKDTLAGIELLLTNATKQANEINQKYQNLSRLKSQLEEVKEQIKQKTGIDKKKLIGQKEELENGKMLLESGIRNLQQLIDMANNTLTSNATKREELLKQWYTLNDNKKAIQEETFELSVDSEFCPTCGQRLPDEMIEQKLKEMEENFYKNKEKALKEIELAIKENVAQGKALKENTEQTKKDLELAKNELKAKQTKLEEIIKSIAELDAKILEPIPEPDYSQYQEYTELVEKIEQLQTELDKPVEDKSKELLQEKSEIQAKIDELNAILNSKAEIEKKKSRIEELKAEEKRIAGQIAELEGIKYLLDLFVVTKINLLEDKINSKFKFVKFKMFNEQVNGGIAETCQAMVNTNGKYVIFDDGNLAGKVNAGLDIINVLCEHYNVTAPIFIDNRESISEIIPTDSQIINLIKPPTWDELDDVAREAIIEKHEGDAEKAKKAWNDRNKTLRVVE